MRISNVLNTYELVLLLLINYSKISAGWNKGKYFSDYEYPEIQLLFSAREETHGEEGNKSGSSSSGQDKTDFSSILNKDTNTFLESSDQKKLTNEQRMKPWMRSPYVDVIKDEKKSDDGDMENNSEEPKFLEENDSTPNNQSMELPPNELEERPWQQREEKPIQKLKSFGNLEKETDSDSTNNVERKIVKYHRKLQTNKNSPVRGNEQMKIKGQLDKVRYGNNKDLSPNEASDTGNDSVGDNQKLKLRKIQDISNRNDINKNIYTRSRSLPEYEDNIQDYDELTGLNNKNEAMAVHNQRSNSSAVPQTKVVDSSLQKSVDSKILNGKIEISNLRNIVTYEPVKFVSTVERATDTNNGITSINKAQPFVTENSGFVSSMPSSFFTKTSLLSVQEKSKNFNSSQVKEDTDKENKILVKQSNRALQENHPLLAKPPVKIAGTLIDKHSEEDNEASVEEKGNKDVKVAQINSILRSSSSSPNSRLSAESRNNSPQFTREKELENAALFFGQYTPQKKKRNVSENKSPDNVKEIPDLALVGPPKKPINSKTSEKKSHSELLEDIFDTDADETSEARKNKLINKPQYYSLTKSNSLLGKVNNLMTKLKEPVDFRRKKNREHKFTDSYKRNVAPAYDQSYELSYDYFRNKDSRRGNPIHSYYDYENEYGMDYDKDYPRVSHSNITSLAAEKEFGEYERKSYSNNYPKNKMKRKKYRKTEETYNDIFAHPLSLDDPELQIVREEDEELVKRRLNHKNFANRHNKGKPPDRFSQYHNDKSAMEYLPRGHFRKIKGEQALHPRHNKLKEKQTMSENLVMDKKIQ